jgi:predicted MFS family arabinose efflux permease
MAILGSALLKILVKHFKGRYLMIYMDILAILGMLIQDIRLSLFPLIIGRMVLGFVVGVNSGLVAQYTFSVTPNTLSGSVGALRQVFLNVGVALGYALGFLIDKNNINDSLNWRILLSFPIITCLIRAILLFTVLPY